MPPLTIDRVMGWQAFAELAEIRDITPEAVTAFRAAGADGLSEFARWPLSRALAAFPSGPADEVAGWQRHAERLLHTGVLNGTVRLKNGTPVSDAEITLGGQKTTTDPRGRFRVVGLALDRRLALTIHHTALGHKLVLGVRPTRSSAVTGSSYTLVGRKQAPKKLSSMKGDRLPPLGSAPVATRAETGAPDPADILMVINRYANGDARAASRFLDFEAGRFLRRTYRIAENALPVGLQDGDDIEWTGSLWALARYASREIGAISRHRGALRKLPPEPWTEAQRLAALKALARAQKGR